MSTKQQQTLYYTGDRRIGVDELATELGVSHGGAHIADSLGYLKVCGPQDSFAGSTAALKSVNRQRSLEGLALPNPPYSAAREAHIMTTRTKWKLLSWIGFVKQLPEFTKLEHIGVIRQLKGVVTILISRSVTQKQFYFDVWFGLWSS